MVSTTGYLLIYLFIHLLFFYLFIHSFIHSLIHSFIHPSIHLFIHLFIYSFIYHFFFSNQNKVFLNHIYQNKLITPLKVAYLPCTIFQLFRSLYGQDTQS